MASEPTYEALEQRVKELEKEAAEGKHTEKSLRASEEKWRSLVENAPSMFIIVDRDGIIQYVNHTASGIEVEKVVGTSAYDYALPEYHRVIKESIKHVFETGQVCRYESKAGHSGGDLASYVVQAGPIKNESQVVAVALIATDVTERKLAEEALQKRGKHYRDTVDAMKDWILVVDPDLRIVLFNEAFKQVSKELALSEDVIGRTPQEVFPFLPDSILDEYRWVFENKAVLTTHETTKVAGADFITESRKIPLLDDGRIVGVVSVIRDITEHRRLEAQLQHAQKMEAIGILAGGVAHDFNNLLMGIQGNASLMLVDMDPARPDYERLKNIEKQAQKGARLTSQLLGYARKGQYEVTPVDLNQLVEETSYAFGRTKKEITIQRELSEDLFPAEADPGQVEQVLLNLLVNAADSMPDGGNLILKTMNVTHKDMKSKLYEPKPGKYILLTVTDTGKGMDNEAIERIFEPFFTTKEMGRGTGLGLASAYGILKAHGGYIDVDSKKGRGTTFSVYLPASEKEVQRPVRTRERVAKGTGTVLIVDDEEVVLEVGKGLLEALGYRVLTASNGKEAIKVYKNNQDNIDIVVLDMTMPTMSGGEAYDHLKKIDPNVKALLSSGYSVDGKATEILDRGCNGFIQKPFTMQELSIKVGEILGEE